MLNLLLITKVKEQHYVLIKDFSKFMYNQTKHKERKHFCMYYLQCFLYEKALINHKENCITINGAQAIKMPKADDMVQFKNYQQLHSLFMVILRLLMKRYTDVNQIMINHIPNHIRSIKSVDMAIRLSVVMMISGKNVGRR